MHLFRLGKKDDFLKNHRFVYLALGGPAEDSDDDADGSLEQTTTDDGIDIQIDARSREDGEKYLDNQVSELLNKIEKNTDGKVDWATKLVGKISESASSKHADNIVHKFHEDKAETYLKEAGLKASKSIRGILAGRVNKWGEGEVHMVSQKLTELRKSKSNLDAAVRENRARAENYNAFLASLRDPDMSERFWSRARKRISRSMFKKLSKKQPERFKELERAQASIDRVEEQTSEAKRAYEEHHREKFDKSLEVSSNFQKYLFSIPAFSKDTEFRRLFPQLLAEDRLTYGRVDDRSEVVKRIEKAFSDKSISEEERKNLRELYGTLFTKKDIEMQKLDKAMNIKTQENNINKETLEKLPENQIVTIKYPMITGITVDKEGNRSVSTRNVSQKAYVDKRGTNLVLRVLYSEMANASKIKRTDVKSYNGPLTGISDIKKETWYTPRAQKITIDLNSGKMSSEMDALYTNKDGKATGVTLRDNREFEEQDDGTFKGINFSGKIPNSITA